MRTLFYSAFIILLAAPLHALTYSWVDDSGTYNFTEDYSRVPKRYQKKVKRRDDPPQNPAPQGAPNPGKAAGRADKGDAKASADAGDEKELYGGKSRAEWRKELDVREAELSVIEQSMEQSRKRAYDAKGISRARFEELKREYDDNWATYDQKYQSYTKLLETVRKAGLTVNIKK